MGRLENKIAVITGAGQGIGRGIAHAMAKEGADIVVAGRSPEKCGHVVQEIQGLGRRAIFASCDIRNKEDVARTVAATVDEFGTVDILVNNAHDTSNVWAPFLDWTDEMLRNQMECSYMASVWFMQMCFPYLKVKGGRIINIASGAAVKSGEGYLGYSACKAAQRAATRVAAREWGQFGITANVICPLADSPPIQAIADRPEEAFGDVWKQMSIKRIGRCEEDIGRAAVYLASEDGSFVTGYTLFLDGGFLMDAAR